MAQERGMAGPPRQPTHAGREACTAPRRLAEPAGQGPEACYVRCPGGTSHGRDAPLAVEVDENAQRKSYTPSERVAIGEAREERDKEEAAQRKHAGQKSGGGRRKKVLPENFTPSTDEGKAREITAAAVGMSWPTYE